MKKKIMPSLLIVLGAMLIELVVMPLRGHIYFVSGVVAYWLYVGFLYLCLSKIKTIKPHTVLLLVLLGWAVLNLPILLRLWEMALPRFMIHLSGILTGYILWEVKKTTKVLTIILGVAICVLYAVFYTYIASIAAGGHLGC